LGRSMRGGSLPRMTKPTLIYFAARGRGELIRLVLAEAAVDYQEHLVGKGTPPSGGRPTDFQALKATGTLPFEALPVWEEPDGFRLAQSGAIANYLARSHGLYPKGEREAARCDEALGAFDDVRLELRKLVTAAPSDRAALREELAAKTLPQWLGYLERMLKANRGGTGFVAGDAVSVADLALWYLLEYIRDNGFGGALEKAPALVAFADRIGNRPRIAEYRGSPRRHPFIPLPA
jgi:glutathione S-transferase